jgi:hypothetical protein
MNKDELNKLILECAKEHKLKKVLKTLISEAIEEIKAENKQSVSEMMDDLDAEVKKINKEYCVKKDDAGFYNIEGCPPHSIKLYHKYNDLFDMTYIKDGTDRSKKLNVSFEDVKKFAKEKLNSKELNYVDSAYNKSAKNSKPASGKDLNEPQKPKEKTEDAVKKEADLPNAPFKEVESIKKQSDHSLKGEKADYTYPKQKDKKLVVKLKSKKLKSKKS